MHIIKGSVECQMNFCTLPVEMGTLPEVKDDEENSSGRDGYFPEVKDVEENSGKNSNPVQNSAKFIRSSEIIFSGLKPNRVNPEKSSRIRSGSSAKSKIRFSDPEKKFYRILI